MIQTAFSSFLVYVIKSNVLLSGPGVCLFQKEKSNLKFRFLQTMLLCLGIIICLFASFFVNKFISADEQLLNFKYPIFVLIVALYQLLEMKIFSKFSNYNYYLYEQSNTFVTDFVFILFLMFITNFELEALDFIINLLALIVAVALSSIVFGFFVDEMNKSSILSSYANVPARLFIATIILILLTYVGMII